MAKPVETVKKQYEASLDNAARSYINMKVATNTTRPYPDIDAKRA
jgi:hypothetical protein